MSGGRPTGSLARGMIHVIELYRAMISPYRPPCCRFTPTCSEYAVDAVGEFGLVRGSWLSLMRLAKCGPWHPGGWDPIPERREVASDATTLRSDSFV